MPYNNYMKKNLLAFVLLLAFGFNNAFSQTKKVVAVMPFLSALPQNKATAAALQSEAIQIFSQHANITLIDRTADPLVLKELDNQIREQSIASSTLVEQGKLSGSKEIIVGILNSVSIESKGNKFSASLNYTLQIDDAATGTLISTQSFSGNTGTQDLGHKVFGALGGVGGTGVLDKASTAIMSDTKDAAVQNAIANSKKQIMQWISEAYPPEIKILSVDARDSKGHPATVTLGGISAAAQSAKNVTINEVTYYESDGRKFKKVKKVAELKLTLIQGEIAEAKVRDGGELLDERMKGGAILQITLN
jgi:hypothetical protein